MTIDEILGLAEQHIPNVREIRCDILDFARALLAAQLAAPVAEPVMELSQWNPVTPYRHCPFCGNFDMKRLPVDCNDKREFFVLCEGCGAQGPTNDRQYVDETVIAWNRRAQLAAPAAPAEARCESCGGNDADMPCAYPGEGKPGCLRDARLAAQPETWKVLPSPALVTGEMLHRTYPGFRGAPWEYGIDKAMWNDWAEQLNAYLAAPTGELKQEAKDQTKGETK